MMTGTSSYIDNRNEALLIPVGKWDHCSSEKIKARYKVQHGNKEKWPESTQRKSTEKELGGREQDISCIEADVLIETTEG